jgi:hypothetical protein
MIIHTNAKSELKKTMMTNTVTRSSKNKSKHTHLLLVGGLIISVVLISSAILLTTMADNSFAQGNNNKTTSTSSTSSNTNAAAAGNTKLDCHSIATKIAGVSIPSPAGLCDVLILRQSPTIIGPSNMNMNKFSVINSIVEVGSAPDLMIKPGGPSGAASASSSPATKNTSGQKVFVMGEFGLLEPQLMPMVKAAVGSNWTIVAVHNHLMQEKPKMIFVHWSAQGDLNTITNQIKNVLLTVSKVPTSNISSSSSH